MLDSILQNAQQQVEAGFPQWRKLPCSLQVRIFNCEQERIWLFDPLELKGLTLTSSVNRRLPLAELSRETFLGVVRGSKNLQQAFLDGELRIFGEQSEALYFTRLFDLLCSCAVED